MNNLDLFFNVFSVVIMPIILVIVIWRFIELKAVNFEFAEMTKSDILTLLAAILMPLNVAYLAFNHTDLLIETIWPTVIIYVSIIAASLILHYLEKKHFEKKYFMIICGTVKANLLLLLCLAVAMVIAFINAGHNERIINFSHMLAIAVFLIIFLILAFALVPFMREMKERQLGKTLDAERQQIFRREELALKKMPNVQLHDLLLKYRSLSDKDYDDYAKYSANENYTYPLIKGEELIGFHLRIICKELNHRNYLNEYWY